MCFLCILCSLNRAHADVLAYGTADSYWTATVRADADGISQSLVQFRSLNSGAPWTTIVRLQSPLRSLTQHGRDVVGQLDNGDWTILRQGGSLTGVQPIDQTRLLLLAGDSQNLWAIGASGIGRAPTTIGATQPAAAMAANTRLLYRLERGTWTMIARLPNEAQESQLMALGPSLDQPLILAAMTEPGRVRMFELDAASRTWRAAASLEVTAAVNRMKLLAGLGRPTLWAAEPGTAGVLSWKDASWSLPVPLIVPAGKLGGGAQDVTVAGRSIRLLVEVEGKINEFSYDRAGKSLGEPVTVPAPSMASEPGDFQWVTGLAAGALFIVLMNTMRRREPVTPESLADAGIQLAPFGRRLAAGLIDAVPVLGTFFVIALKFQDQSPEDVEAALRESPYALYISMGVYVIHTMACELLWGWSIGKRLLGLRVLMIDATRPTPRAIILRNLMRVLDVVMLFLPVMIMILSPLRQRIGDIVAETVVTRDDGKTPPTGRDGDAATKE